MKVDAKLIGQLVQRVGNPVLLGTIIQILGTSNTDEDKFRAVAKMYVVPDIARLRATDTMQAVAFLASMSDTATGYMLTALEKEVTRIGCSVDRSAYHNFLQGATVGVLMGFAETGHCCEQKQKDFGATLLQVMMRDTSTSVVCHECIGGISNAVAEISAKYPHFVVAVLNGLCRCPEEWLKGACTMRICNSFLHKVVANPELTFKQKATALATLQEQILGSKIPVAEAMGTPS